MSEYKLYYLPFKGRAEPIRLLFAYKGIKYEDIRLGEDKWAEFKPKTPFGLIPVLEEDGKMLAGSMTILRYLAEKEEFNLAGSNAWENAQLASIADFISDFTTELVKVVFEPDADLKKALEKKFVEEIAPKYLVKLNEMAADSGHLYDNRMTWPDLHLFNIIHGIYLHQPEIVSGFPNLMKLMSNIETNRNIAKWLAERPLTDH